MLLNLGLSAITGLFILKPHVPIFVSIIRYYINYEKFRIILFVNLFNSNAVMPGKKGEKF